MPVATSKRTSALAVFTALTALTLTACASSSAAESESAPEVDGTPAEVTVTTAQGDVDVRFQPERVIVIEHGILDTIDTLGAGDSVVGIPHHAAPPHLADFATDTVNTGTLLEPD